MDSSDQVIFALKVVLAVGPLALYFLALGLVNSQARPCIVSARSDFSLLAIAVVPVVATPVLILIEHGQMVTAAGVVLGLAVAFLSLLPKAGGSWVVYNCSPAQCRRLVRQACQALGWSLDQTDGDHWSDVRELQQSALPCSGVSLCKW